MGRGASWGILTNQYKFYTSSNGMNQFEDQEILKP